MQFVHNSRLTWTSVDGSQKICLDYPDISLHAISRDLNNFPHECLFLLVDAKSPELRSYIEKGKFFPPFCPNVPVQSLYTKFSLLFVDQLRTKKKMMMKRKKSILQSKCVSFPRTRKLSIRCLKP